MRFKSLIFLQKQATSKNQQTGAVYDSIVYHNYVGKHTRRAHAEYWEIKYGFVITSLKT